MAFISNSSWHCRGEEVGQLWVGESGESLWGCGKWWELADGERGECGVGGQRMRPHTAHWEVVLVGWKVGPFTEPGEEGNLGWVELR